MPPRILESLFGLLLPPAAREQVLGDLHERYTSPSGYLADLLGVLGPVIIGRIRRTTDFELFVIEILTIYLSFVAAAWQFGAHNTFVQLALPAIVAEVCLLFCNAYSNPEKRSIRTAALQITGSLLVALFGQSIIFDSQPNLAVPLRILLYGSALSLALLIPLRIAFPLKMARASKFRQRKASLKLSNGGPNPGFVFTLIVALVAVAFLLSR